MSPWPWLLVLLLLVGQESSGEITEAIAAAGAYGCEQGGWREGRCERGVQCGRRVGAFPEVSETNLFALPSGKLELVVDMVGSNVSVAAVYVLVKVVVWIDKLRGKHVTVATWRRCHGYGVVCKHVVVHGVFVEVTGCVVEEHVGYMGL